MVADSSEGRTTAPAPGNSRNPITERERLIAISNSSELGQSPDPEVAPDAAANIIPPGQGITDLCKASEDGCAVNKAIPIQQLQSRRESREVSDHSSRAPLKPVNSQPRALKTGHSIVKEAPSKKQTASTSGKRNVQLSEDDLFEQLIVKMRQREESEQNATNMQRQMQTENQDLKESNHLLQDRVKKYQAQLAKLSSETKNQRAQIDQWKTRLGAFRGIINELGREYDKVREQTKDLRETAMSLSREKGEIQSTQDDLKIQVSKHAAKFEDQRDKLSTSEGKANILREALQNSEKRGELIKEQLLSDKKRIATLESYIQRESESQARYLTVVRKEQGEMTEKLESIFGLLSESFPETQDAILSKLRPEIQRCVASVEEMKEHCVTEAMNGQGFTSTIQEAASRYVVLSLF
jgi:chromosome segregation ATPase